MKLKLWLPFSLVLLVAIACTSQSNDKSFSNATTSANTSVQAQKSVKSGTFVSGEHPTQGTVWGWLLGAFVLAHLRVYGDRASAREFLEPMANHFYSHGLGSLSEIFDGDAPMTPRGCIAQAWTVAGVLRAWLATEEL